MHGNNKKECLDCKTNINQDNVINICEHRKIKSFCKICIGTYCIHYKKIALCIDCDGSALCKTELCENIGYEKYNGHCLRCCIYLFPDIKVIKNYKTKERAVVEFVKNKFSTVDWINDKKIEDGCSRKRPDLLGDFGSHIIIIEVDENAHSNYDCSCENKRLMILSQDVNHRPIVFIRFNPDEYINVDGKKIISCWILYEKKGILVLNPDKLNDWTDRLNKLYEQIKYWIENLTEKTIEIIELFY
jgi:hypothetical protein